MSPLFKSFCAVLILLTFLIPKSYAQSFDNIAADIRTGNSNGLAKYFGANVEISMKDAQNSYSKPQAEAVLKNFFGGHVPKTFSVVHQGQSPEGAKYFIGTLNTSAGNYRTYVYAKQIGANFVIQEIRFETQ